MTLPILPPGPSEPKELPGGGGAAQDFFSFLVKEAGQFAVSLAKGEVTKSFQEGMENSKAPGKFEPPGREEWSSGDWLNHHWGEEVPLQLYHLLGCNTCKGRLAGELHGRFLQGLSGSPQADYDFSTVLHNATRGWMTYRPNLTLPNNTDEVVRLPGQRWSPEAAHRPDPKFTPPFGFVPPRNPDLARTYDPSVPKPAKSPSKTSRDVAPLLGGRDMLPFFPPETKKIPLDGKAQGQEHAIHAFSFTPSEIQEISNEIGSPEKASEYVMSFRCKKGETRAACRERMIKRGKIRFGG
jgi:hypothetical protein